MSAEWIEHKGKKILYIDYRNLPPQQMLDLIREATQIIVTSGSKENLSLTDVTGCSLNNEFIELAKECGKSSLLMTKKAAILGVYGARKIILNMINAVSPKPRKPFDTVEDAKDWLIE
jgi:hypothetical protein